MAKVRFVRTTIGPLLSGMQSLRSVAWVPAAELWFGLTDATIYFVVLLGSVPSIVLVSGIDQVPPIRLIMLPPALPGTCPAASRAGRSPGAR